MRNALVYLLFILIVTGAGIYVGVNNLPGDWYQGLNKPVFNPPNWIFAPVWTVLYIMIGIAGARVFLAGHYNLMGLWLLQMVVNLIWTPVFFGEQNIGLALIIILLLLVLILAFIIATRKREPVAAWLFAPYAVWVAFASVLNLALYQLN